jgi:hypothetical protein
MPLIAVFNALVLSNDALSPPVAGARLMFAGCAAGGLPTRLGLNSISIFLLNNYITIESCTHFIYRMIEKKLEHFHRACPVE